MVVTHAYFAREIHMRWRQSSIDILRRLRQPLSAAVRGKTGAGPMPVIYKIVPQSLWAAAEAAGTFIGAPVDIADGYIHFSTAAQAPETAARHFSGQRGLLLVAADTAKLGAALHWEVSRGGTLFPHLYAALAPADCLWVKPLPLGPDGAHVFPGLDP